MYLVFGFLALIAFFSHPQYVRGAGLFLGLALSVKLSAIVFVGPMVLGSLFGDRRKNGGRCFTRCAMYALAVFTLVLLSTNLLFSLEGRRNTVRSLLPQVQEESISADSTNSLISSYALMTLVESLLTLHGYLYSDAPDSIEATGTPGVLSVAERLLPTFPRGAGLIIYSPWHFWLFMQTPITYYHDVGGVHQIVLTGNPVLWYLSTLAVIVGLVVVLRYAKEYFYERKEFFFSFFILLGGYVSCLVPFIFVVERSTYLYHYLPAYLFALSLLAWFISRMFSLDGVSDMTRRTGWFFVCFLGIVVFGFLYTLPTTYGF
jgi:dolichyl-phosphate-mannose--protein O-mannosyl transferase